VAAAGRRHQEFADRRRLPRLTRSKLAAIRG
jgi:hypothetical protein